MPFVVVPSAFAVTWFAGMATNVEKRMTKRGTMMAIATALVTTFTNMNGPPSLKNSARVWIIVLSRLGRWGGAHPERAASAAKPR